MDRAKQINDICQQLEVVVRCGQKMKNHTALAVGGEIDAIAYPETPEAAATLVSELEKNNIPWSALGRGSRILAKDKAINRVAISLKLLEEVLLFKDVEDEKHRDVLKIVQVHGGYQLSKLAIATVERGFWELQNFASDLGTVGSAVHRKEQKDLYMTTLNNFICVYEGKVREFSALDIYDEVEEKGLRLVLGAAFTVIKIQSAFGQEKHTKTVNRLLKKRRDDLLGTGPIFQEKAKGRVTERLISNAGLKGFSCGNAVVGSHMANFIVNHQGKATVSEILELIDQVKEKVKQHSGIELKLALEIWE